MIPNNTISSDSTQAKSISDKIKYQINLENWFPITTYKFDPKGNSSLNNDYDNNNENDNDNDNDNENDDIDFFGTSNDICSICRNNLIDKCPTCKKTLKKNKCFISNGECLHFFHKHCIIQWLKTRNVCPSDMLPFVFDKTNIDSSGDADFLKIIHDIIKNK